MQPGRRGRPQKRSSPPAPPAANSARRAAASAGLVGGDFSRYRGDDEEARELRRAGLSGVRGYGRSAYLFAGFPEGVTWKLVAVPISELREWRYAYETTWLRLSEYSRLVRVGARNVGKVPSVQTTSDCIRAIEQDVRNGKSPSSFTPSIAAALDEESPHVIAEGHSRATAFVRALDPQEEVEVIVGYSPRLASWGYYRL